MECSESGFVGGRGEEGRTVKNIGVERPSNTKMVNVIFLFSS